MNDQPLEQSAPSAPPVVGAISAAKDACHIWFSQAGITTSIGGSAGEVSRPVLPGEVSRPVLPGEATSAFPIPQAQSFEGVQCEAIAEPQSFINSEIYAGMVVGVILAIMCWYAWRTLRSVVAGVSFWLRHRLPGIIWVTFRRPKSERRG